MSDVPPTYDSLFNTIVRCMRSLEVYYNQDPARVGAMAAQKTAGKTPWGLKKKESVLRRLALDLLREEALETAPPKEGGDSLDAQVDRYLTDYEQAAKTAKKEGFDFRMMTRRLLEADDEEGDAGGADAKEAPPAAAEPTKPGVADIDVEEFSNSVARLIQNYDNLLEVRNTLIRRAINFVSKGYNQEAVDALVKLLRNEHGLVDGESKEDVEDEMYPAPPADRAGPGGAGA